MFDLMLAYFDEYVTQRVQKETGETGHQLEAMLDEHRSADVVQFAARLSDAFLTILDTDAHTFGTAYGRFFIDQGATELGISQVLGRFSSSLPSLMQHVNSLHLFTGTIMGSFSDVWISSVGSDCFHLHFKCSNNDHFVYWLEGAVDEMARRYFSRAGVAVTLLEECDTTDHQVLKVSVLPGDPSFSDHVQQQEALLDHANSSICTLEAPTFYQMFPFHLVLDEQCRVVQAGSALRRLFPGLAVPAAHHVHEYFQIMHPASKWTFAELTKQRRQNLQIVITSSQGLELKGNLIHTNLSQSGEPSSSQGSQVTIFTGSPCFGSLEELKRHGLFLNDLSSYDMSLDLLLAREAHQSDLLEHQEEVLRLMEERDKAESACQMLRKQVLSTATGSARNLGGGLQGFLGTPADDAIRLLDKLLTLGGEAVSVSELAMVRDGLLKAGTDLRQPVNLTSHVFDEFTGGDDEVNQSLMNLLVSRKGSLRNEVDDALSNYQAVSGYMLGSIQERPDREGIDGWDHEGSADELNIDVGDDQPAYEVMQHSAHTSASSRDSRREERLRNSGGASRRPVHKPLFLANTSQRGSASSSELRNVGRFATMSSGDFDVTEISPTLASPSRAPQFPGHDLRDIQRRVFSLGGNELNGLDKLLTPSFYFKRGKSESGALNMLSRFEQSKRSKKSRSTSSSSIMGRVKGAIKGLFGTTSASMSCQSSRSVTTNPSSVNKLGLSVDSLCLDETSQANCSMAAVYNSASSSLGVDGSDRAEFFDRVGSLSLESNGRFPSSSRSTPGVYATTHDSAHSSFPTVTHSRSSATLRDEDKNLDVRSSYRSSGNTHSSERTGFDSACSDRRSYDELAPGTRLHTRTPTRASFSYSAAQAGTKKCPSFDTSPTGEAGLRDSGGNRLSTGNIRIREAYLAGSAASVTFPECNSSKSPSSRLWQPVFTSSEGGMANTTPRASSCQMTHIRKVASAGPMSPGIKAHPDQAVMTLIKEPPSELSRVLEKMDDWQFDIFELQRATNGRPLSVMAFTLFKRAEIISRFGLNEQKLIRFLVYIEDGYPPNPYHCREHAADVLHLLHVIATRGGLIKQAAPVQLEPGEIMDTINSSKTGTGLQLQTTSLKNLNVGQSPQNTEDARLAPTRNALSLLTVYLAAIIHDFDHRGVNNQFLIQTGDPLALLYNDVSPMENHHIAAAFTMLREERFNFLEKMPKKVFSVLRTQVIDMVLATDMKQHFSLVSLFQSKVAATKMPTPCTSPDTAALSQAHGPSTHVSLSPRPSHPELIPYRTLSSLRLRERSELYENHSYSGHHPLVSLHPSAGGREHQARRKSMTMADAGLQSDWILGSEKALRPGSTLEGKRMSVTSFQRIGHRDIAERPRRPTTEGGEVRSMDGGITGRRMSTLLGNLLAHKRDLGIHNSCEDTLLLSNSLANKRDSAIPYYCEDLCLGSSQVAEDIGARLSEPLGGAPSPRVHMSFSVGPVNQGSLPEPSGSGVSGVSTPTPTPAPPAAIDSETMGLVWKVAIKCADLSNLANSERVARKWVLQLEEEMFRQGDREKAAGLPISALMDRSKAGVTKSQPGFFNVVVLPLFSSFVNFFPAAAPMLDGAKQNLAMWNDEQEQQKQA